MKLFVSFIGVLVQLVGPVLLLNGFHGQHIILAGYHYPPYDILIRNPDGNYTLRGCSVEAHYWMFAKINVTYSILPINDPEEIAKIGIYEAAFSKLTTKKADTIGSSYIVDPKRAARMDYTSGIAWTEPYNLVVPKPEFQSRLFAFVFPFQPQVWIGLLLSLILTILSMTLFSWIYKKYPQPVQIKKENKNIPSRNDIEHPTTSTRNISFYTISVLDILTNHVFTAFIATVSGNFIPYSQNSFRILAGGFLLASLVLVNSYSSIVMSSLTVPIRNPAVNSLEDLVNNKDVALILQKNTALGISILSAETGLYKTLGDELRRHPDRIITDVPLMIKYLEGGKYAHPWLSSFNRNIIVKQYKKHGECRLQLSDPISMSSGYFLLLLQKDSKYTQAYSHGLMYLWETGLNHYWIKHLSPTSADACFDKKQSKAKTTSKPSAIKLVDLTSSFFILGIGFGLGMICFIVEIISGLFKRRR